MSLSNLDVAEALAHSGSDSRKKKANVETRWAAINWMCKKMPLLDAAIESHTKTCLPIGVVLVSQNMDWYSRDVTAYKPFCPSVHTEYLGNTYTLSSRDVLSSVLKLREAYATDIAGIKAACAEEAKQAKADAFSKFQFKTPVLDSGCTEQEWRLMLKEIDAERESLKKRARELDDAVCIATRLENLRRCIDCPIAKCAKR